MNKKIITYNQAERISKKLHSQNQIIGLKTGCFDVFHVGHLKALQHAKAHCDVLIVGLGSNSTLKTLKGQNRPIFSETERAEVIAGLSVVDYVVVLKEKLIDRIDHRKLIGLMKPNVYFLPPNDKALPLKKDLAKKYGIKIKFKKEYKPDQVSTSKILNNNATISQPNR